MVTGTRKRRSQRSSSTSPVFLCRGAADNAPELTTTVSKAAKKRKKYPETRILADRLPSFGAKPFAGPEDDVKKDARFYQKFQEVCCCWKCAALRWLTESLRQQHCATSWFQGWSY